MSILKSDLVTETHLRQYRDEGYTVVRGLIPAEMMLAIRDELARLESGDYEAWPTRLFQFVNPAAARCPNGLPLPLGVQQPAAHSETFRAVADHPGLQGAMSKLLGGPVSRFTDQAAIKSRYITTEQAGRSYYHQDSYYWRIAPEHGCNVWIPADTVGKDAIALAIKPGTQKSWKLTPHESYNDDPEWGHTQPDGGFKSFARHRIPFGDIDFSDEIVIEAEPGDAIFFSNFTWHRSEPNYCGESKHFYAIAYRRSDVDQTRITI